MINTSNNNLWDNLITSKSFVTDNASCSNLFVPATSPIALWWSLVLRHNFNCLDNCSSNRANISEPSFSPSVQSFSLTNAKLKYDNKIWWNKILFVQKICNHQDTYLPTDFLLNLVLVMFSYRLVIPPRLLGSKDQILWLFLIILLLVLFHLFAWQQVLLV